MDYPLYKGDIVMNDQKPKHFLIFKIIGFIGVVIGIIGIILLFLGVNNSDNTFMIGGFVVCFGMFIGIGGLVIGFRPEISKLSTKSKKYIVNDNKDDLTDIANTSADIVDGAITQTARAVKKGLTQKESMFCKYCGAQIDSDSKFCNKCGKEQ